MDGSLRPGLALVAVLLVATVMPPTAGASATNGMGLQGSVDPDLVNLNVELTGDGNAAWEIEYFVRLRTDNETQAFEDLIADVEANESAYIDRFSTRINGTVADAAETTGREMTATNFSVDAEIRSLGNQYGVLTYTFTWSNFATGTDGTVTAGDALEGFFLDQETSLQFTWQEGYQVASVSPEPTSTRERTVVWRGPLDFASGEPRLTIEPVSDGTTQGTTGTSEGTTPGGTTTDGGPTTPTEPDQGTSIWLWVIGGIVILALLGAGLWYWQEGGQAEDRGGEPAASPPSELLSNEERVEQFLESEGGRSKQQEIVDGLDWTEAKTSQVLSEMQEAGRIEKFRIGRENVVKLPDTDGESE